MKNRILLIDDDARLAGMVADYLGRSGFEVTVAGTGSEGLARQKADGHDAIILDLMLPDMDGLEVCRTLRATDAVPVLMLTAKGDPMDRIVGLELGADDYLPKPFEPRELVARIRTVLRRVHRGSQPNGDDSNLNYCFEEWTLDPLKRRLHDPEGVLVPISTAEFRLLRAFLNHPQQVLDRDQLLDMVQGRSAHLFDRAVDNQVSRLRRKIEANSRNPQFIQTVRGGGYSFGAQVKRIAREEEV